MTFVTFVSEQEIEFSKSTLISSGEDQPSLLYVNSKVLIASLDPFLLLLLLLPWIHLKCHKKKNRESCKHTLLLKSYSNNLKVFIF